MAESKEVKTMKDVVKEWLKMPAAVGEDTTMQEAIVVAMMRKAAKGDIRAAEIIRDILVGKME